MLVQIGNQLDEHVFPRVANGGIVVLSEVTVPSTMSTEKDHGRKAKRGSAARPRPRTTGWQGPSGGSRPPGATAPVVGAGLQPQVEEQLSGLQEQYPGTQLWRQDLGAWLLTPSRLLPGLGQHAVFAIAVHYATGLIRSWGFWSSAVMPACWIGPRHTNAPDGSICAFDMFDGTWTWAMPLVTLLDLYSLWAFRHLHLNVLGRWPGGHVAHFRGEKLLEFGPDEYCGCADGKKRYRDCCMQKDLTESLVERSLRFSWLGGDSRKPPEEVVRFVCQRDRPPAVEEVLPTISEWIANQWRSEASVAILQHSARNDGVRTDNGLLGSSCHAQEERRPESHAGRTHAPRVPL